MKIRNFGEFVFEARRKDDPRYQYNEITKLFDKGARQEVTAVELDLSSSPSGEVTKLINEYVKTKELFDQAKESHEAVKETLKNTVDEAFDEKDKLLTRYIKTKTYMFTFSKYTQKKTELVEKKDYEKIIAEFMELFPELRKGLEEIIKNNTKLEEVTSAERSGSIKVSHIEKVNEGVKDIFTGMFDKVKKITASLAKTLRKITVRIDKRFSKIDKLMENLK